MLFDAINHARRSRHPVVLAALAGLLAALAPPLAAPAAAESIVSPGPLTQVNISPHLNCDIRHVDDAAPEWYSATACGTFFAAGGTLWGPPDVPAAGGAGPRTGYQPVSSTMSGSGTLADPYRSTTVVTLPGSSLTITQVDSYVVGREDYRTSATVTNSAGTAVTGILYTAGDCFLQNSDAGYGLQQGSSAVCSTSPAPGGRIEALVPITAGNRWQQDGYHAIWSVIGSQQHFQNTCRCTEFIDNGIGLSWDVTVPAGGSATIRWDTGFSPRGVQPLTVDAVADAVASRVGTRNGYVITVCNNNIDPYELTSLTVTLPASFRYEPSEQIGFYAGPPAISGDRLTWTGSVGLGPGACLEMHFRVDVGTRIGTFTIDADATAVGIPVNPTTDAAPITVHPPGPEELTDLGVAKTASPDPVIAGDNLTYRVTVTNHGPAVSQPYSLVDVLPVGTRLVASASDDRCDTVTDTAVGQRVTCAGTALTAGASSSFSLVAAIDGGLGDGSVLVNVATVEVPDGLLDPDPRDDAAVAVSNVRRVVDVTIGLAFRPDEVAAGGMTVLAATVANRGPSTAEDVTFTIRLPAGLAFGSTRVKGEPPDCTRSGRTLTCQLAYLVAGEDPTFLLPVSTGDIAAGRHAATGTVTAPFEMDPADNAGTAVLRILEGLANTGVLIAKTGLIGVALLVLGVVLRHGSRGFALGRLSRRGRRRHRRGWRG